MIELEFCKRDDLRYQQIRNRHYVPNSGTHGQQLHFLVWYERQIAGIISGASSVYGVKARDEFFKFSSVRKEKESLYLPAVINNTVFRLETHEPNLGTKVLGLWRKTVARLWEEMYGVPIIGFETFVVENDHRKGSMYKADNWAFVGETAGSTKKHGVGGAKAKAERLKTDKKLIFCRWAKHPVVPKTRYVGCWRNETPEEKLKLKTIKLYRESLLGKTWSWRHVE